MLCIRNEFSEFDTEFHNFYINGAPKKLSCAFLMLNYRIVRKFNFFIQVDQIIFNTLNFNISVRFLHFKNILKKTLH